MNYDNADLEAFFGNQSGGADSFTRIANMPAFPAGTNQSLEDVETSAGVLSGGSQSACVYCPTENSSHQIQPDDHEIESVGSSQDIYQAVEDVVGSAVKPIMTQLDAIRTHQNKLERQIEVLHMSVSSIEAMMRASTLGVTEQLKKEVASMSTMIGKVVSKLDAMCIITGSATGTVDAVTRCLVEGKPLPSVPCVADSSQIPTIFNIAKTSPKTREQEELVHAIGTSARIEAATAPEFGAPDKDVVSMIKDIMLFIPSTRMSFYETVAAYLELQTSADISKILSELSILGSKERTRYLENLIEQSEISCGDQGRKGPCPIKVMTTLPSGNYIQLEKKPTKKQSQSYRQLVKVEGVYYGSPI